MKNADCLVGWCHGLIPFNKLNIHLEVVLFVVLIIGGHTLVFGQSPELSITKKQLYEATGQLESNSAGDLDKFEAVLKRAIKEPAFRELATCSLALSYVKRSNLESVANFLRRSDKFLPTPTLTQQNFLHRVQLSLDIIKGSEAVTEGFSNLVRSTLDKKLVTESRLASGALLGTLIGMLEPDAAISPIDRDFLTSAKDSLLESKNTELVNNFNLSYRKAKTHADALANWIATHQELSLDKATDLAAVSEESYRAAIRDRDQMTDSEQQEIREHRKNTLQLTKKKQAIQQEINAVLFQWNSHLELHNPIVPDRRTIQVPTKKRVKVGSHTESKRKTRKNAKGEREVYYVDEEVDDFKTEDIPQKDVDRHIDTIFQQQMTRYLALKAAGQALMDQKANWDSQFRDALAEIKAESRAIEQIESKAKDEQADLKRLRSETKIAREVMNALQSGRLETAFRPPNFELLDYALETKALRNQEAAVPTGAAEP